MTIITVIIAIFLLQALGAALLTYLFMLYEGINTANEEARPFPAAYSVSGLVRGIFTCFLSQLIVNASYLFGYIGALFPTRPQASTSKDSTRPVVLFVHGLYHNPSGWIAYKHSFKQAGYEDMLFFSYFSFHTEYEEIAQRLMTRIRAVHAAYARPVVLVGHSLGGLLVRRCVSDAETAERVACAVTLGAPHKGSKLAALGIGGLARSLLYKGKLIHDIEVLDSPAAMPCLSLFSPIDNFVLPEEGLRIAVKGWTEEQVQPVSHIFMLYSKKIRERVLKFVQAQSTH